MNGPVELLGVAASGLLVLVAVAVSWWAGLGLGRDLIEASLRALVQLALLGLVLAAMIGAGPATGTFVAVGGGDGAVRRLDGAPAHP